MSVVNQAVENAVGGGGVADLFVPARHGKLRGQDRSASLIAVLSDFPGPDPLSWIKSLVPVGGAVYQQPMMPPVNGMAAANTPGTRNSADSHSRFAVAEGRNRIACGRLERR